MEICCATDSTSAQAVIEGIVFGTSQDGDHSLCIPRNAELSLVSVGFGIRGAGSGCIDYTYRKILQEGDP